MHKYLVEFIGAFILVLVVVLTANNGAGQLAPAAVGAAYAGLIVAGAAVSGAHYNPAITLSVFLLRRLSRTDLFYYIVAQLAGGGLGAVIAIFLLHCGPAPRIDPALRDHAICAVVAELIGTFALVYGALRALSPREGQGPGTSYGFALGLSLAALLYALGPVSGGAFNPAVALGLCISGNFNLEDSWIFVVGPVLGAAAGATFMQSIDKTE